MRDMTHEEVLRGLQYIADSPAHEHGGFHPEAVKTAKAAIELIQGASSSYAALRERILDLEFEIRNTKTYFDAICMRLRNFCVEHDLGKLNEHMDVTICTALVAAEAKVAALEEQIKTRDKCSFSGAIRNCPTHGESKELTELRDSRDRLQEALRPAAELFEAILVGKQTPHSALRKWAKKFSVRDGQADTLWLERIERCVKAALGWARAALGDPERKGE